MSDAELPPVTFEDLHAYADGQLSRVDRARVEVHLRENPEAAARVRDYRTLNAALRAAADAGEVGTLPRIRPLAPVVRRWPAIAAALLIGVCLGGGLGWTGRFVVAPSVTDGLADLAQRTRAAYRVYAADLQRPVEMTEADRLTAWLSQRMNTAVRVPKLDEVGFTLVGGRLMIGDRDPAAMLMYQDERGRRIVLYLRNDLPVGHVTGMQYRGDEGGGVVYWRDARMGFGLAGDFAERELKPVASRIRAGYAS